VRECGGIIKLGVQRGRKSPSVRRGWIASLQKAAVIRFHLDYRAVPKGESHNCCRKFKYLLARISHND